MPKLIILRGYCGVGKTSLAKYLAQKHKWALLVFDYFLWKLNTSKKHSKQDYDVTLKNLLDVTRNYMKIKRNIVIEGALVQRAKFDSFDINKFVNLARKNKYKVVRFFLTADEKVCGKRMKQRKWIVPKWENKMLTEQLHKTKHGTEIHLDTSDLTLRQTINRIEKLI